MSELKPCPFCGGDSVTWQSLGGHTRAGCVDCGAEVTRPMGLYRNAMIEWNTRPIEDELRKRITELEEAQRWRVVADGELPDDDVEVFVLLYGSSVSTGKHYRNARHLDLEDNSYDLNYVIGDYWLIGDDEITCAQHCYNTVTHWMPLPEPPIVYGKVCEK